MARSGASISISGSPPTPRSFPTPRTVPTTLTFRNVPTNPILILLSHPFKPVSAISVLNQYLNNFLPRAIDLNAAIATTTNYTDAYVYTTHAWVIRLLWECGQDGGKKGDEIGLRYGGRVKCPDEFNQRKVGR